MQQLVDEAGLGDRIVLDSAGTSAHHVGEKPDRRSREAASRRGIDVDGASRQFRKSDFGRFDYVIAMDASNLAALQRMADAEERTKLTLLRDHDPKAAPGAEVPDPYYGGGDGFERVLDICDAACRGLLAEIREAHGL